MGINEFMLKLGFFYLQENIPIRNSLCTYPLEPRHIKTATGNFYGKRIVTKNADKKHFADNFPKFHPPLINYSPNLLSVV